MTGAAKAALLEIALRVCADIKENDFLKARQGARAEAIARAFHVFRVMEPVRRAGEW
ncbi:hypothetical protein [Methylocystis suflitae]|uniref:hypothetical protein n=1 Tax=Methylocystis suflitae TaxID=2951405 RepID=UPI00210E54F3|nr:hypothetical protein [Methylocystis suflitae]MCQ4189876.1 hypothetical protein [Methylocystis suflitae]